MSRWMMLAAALLAAGCKNKVASDPKGAVGPQTVLARVGDTTITTADLKDILARYANQPFVLARYSSIEKKKELLDSLIRYEVLAIEARERGYARDPEVQRAAKDKMVRLFSQQEINDKVKLTDVPESELRKFYQDHGDDYVRPEAVRVSQIVVKDRAKATRVLAAAKALAKPDLKAFRELVAKDSEDADSKQRGGDLTQLDRSTTQYPAALVRAAFALREVGDVSELIPTDQGFVILKLTEHRAAVSRSFDEVKLEIQKRLVDELRAKRKQELVDQARQSMRVEIYDDELAKLDLPSTVGKLTGAAPAATSSPGIDAGGVVGMRP